jgi:hypothetical protein
VKAILRRRRRRSQVAAPWQTAAFERKKQYAPSRLHTASVGFASRSNAGGAYVSTVRSVRHGGFAVGERDGLEARIYAECLHRARKLVADGCPLGTALRILL